MSEKEVKAINDRMAAVSFEISSINFIDNNRSLDAIKNVIINGYSFRINY